LKKNDKKWKVLLDGRQPFMNARCLNLEIGYLTKDLPRMGAYIKGPDQVVLSCLDFDLYEGEQALRVTVDGVYIPYEEI